MMRRLRTARFWILVSVLLLAMVASSSSQTRATADATPADAAARALNEGRYDEVDRLLRGATDPRSTVLLAQALLERGRYADAQALLAPRAASAPGSDPAVEFGLLQIQLGQRDAGRRTLARVLISSGQTTAADFVRLGRAARALGQFQDANGFFRRANQLAPTDVTANVQWGELFLEKYNKAEALKSFQAALAADPGHIRAQLGLARVLADENPPESRKALAQVLKTNPGSVDAHLLTAELAMDDRRRDDAQASVRKALATNPNSLEGRSLEGAIALLEGRTADFDAATTAVLKINAGYGEVYRVAGEQLARNYRFEEALVQTRKALALDPNNMRAYADLGMQLLRLGDEPGARQALETAFKADPFDVPTYNSLSLLDTLDKFVTVREGDLILRFHPDEADIMREQAVPLAKEAMAALTRRWDFTPAGPILIELFPKHDDFAVRTMGLPGLVGALGVCFGKVVTLDSPKARPPGSFSWEETLWHELAHVYTLQMSNQRVPRWLTEGISEWEETRAGRGWGRAEELNFAQALETGKALKVKDLNDGFTNPELISLSYYEASVLVDHLVETYGEPKLRSFVRSFATGIETDEALKQVYGLTVDQVQASFDTRLDRQFGPIRRAMKTPEVPKDADVAALQAAIRENPDSFALQMRLGVALRAGGDRDGAIKAFERAGELLPVAGGSNNPHAFIAQIALEKKDTARAIQALEAQLKIDHYDVEVARQLAGLLAPQGDARRVTPVYERVVELDPFDAGAHAALGRLALGRRDAPRAVRAFRAALAAKPADQATAHTDLAEAYLLDGKPADAKQQALAALEIAPTFERAQDLLLRLVDRPGGE